MTAPLARLVPAIRFEACNQFLNFRWHTRLIVLRSSGGGLVEGMLPVSSAFCLPECALARRSQMLGPFARDGDLIGTLLGHGDLRPRQDGFVSEGGPPPATP